ncbi:MAG: LacI family DNA-binding transcriptional regulator [Halanaerobiales bacterium]
MSKISIKDVAELAGVSPTTVSRVINDSDHPVSEDTRRAVEMAIKELNFEPNRLARGLIKNKSNIIGVIVHDISDPYFAEILKGIEEVTAAYDYILNIYNTYRNVEKELEAVKTLRAIQADGVVFTGGSLLDEKYRERMKWYVQELKKRKVTIVGIATHPFAIKNIQIGNTFAARTITGYLYDKGHEKIAYVNGPEILSTTRERLQGYRQALQSHHLIFDESLIIPGDFTFSGGREAARLLLDRISEITAVVCANDETALGLIWELKNCSIRVPEEVSVVGIGNIPEARYSYPPLTTMSLPIRRIGLLTGSYLINGLLNREELNIKEDMEISLVERESVYQLK